MCFAGKITATLETPDLKPRIDSPAVYFEFIPSYAMFGIVKNYRKTASIYTVPEVNVLWGQMSSYQLQNKSKIPCDDAESESLFSETSPVLTRAKKKP